MTLIIVTVSSFCLLGIALSVSAAVSDKASRDNMRDMTVTGALRRR
jgi:hypothetical protein